MYPYKKELTIQPTTDWEAKYNKLITEGVYDLADRLLDAQNCIAVQEREITKLKNYIINQLLNNETRN